MEENGAEGKTKDEILVALGIADLEQFNNDAKYFIENSAQSSFKTANSIWFNSDYSKRNKTLDFSDAFKTVMQNYYFAPATKINNATGAAVVNDWVSKETNGKINNIITDEMVRKSLSLLVNAIYFKDDWHVQFDDKATKNDTFTDRKGMKKTTLFMNHNGRYQYHENDNFQILAKPYQNNNIKMYLVLPKIGKTATHNKIEDAIKHMRLENVELSLPKFKTEYLHNDLVGVLRNMGVKTAFDPKQADFFKMYNAKKPRENIYIGQILQKTLLEVDEKGSEASAATVIRMERTAATLNTFVFKCDRPFTYFIRNDATGDILFMGEYAFVE